jgi:hypothetical protein
MNIGNSLVPIDQQQEDRYGYQSSDAAVCYSKEMRKRKPHTPAPWSQLLHYSISSRAIVSLLVSGSWLGILLLFGLNNKLRIYV